MLRTKNCVSFAGYKRKENFGLVTVAREIFFVSVVGLNSNFRVDKKRIFTELDVVGSTKLLFLFSWKLSMLRDNIGEFDDDDYRDFHRKFTFKPFEDFHFTIRQSQYVQYWFKTFLQKNEDTVTYGAITSFVRPRVLMLLWLENGFCSSDFKEITLSFKNINFKISKMLLKELNIKPLKLGVRFQFVEVRSRREFFIRVFFELESLFRLFCLILPHIPDEEFFEHFCLDWPDNYLQRWIIAVNNLTPKFNKVLAARYKLAL